MKVKVSVVGYTPGADAIEWYTPGADAIEWPDDWPVPHVGDEVTLRDGTSAFIRTVVWYPQGSSGEDYPSEPADPFVYLVIGQRRPSPWT